MRTLQVDVAVIGAGTGGLNAHRAAEKAGCKTVLIESGPYGTTCARVGCMPSKLFIQAALQHHEIQRADQFGIRVPDGVTIDAPALFDRVRRERDYFAGFAVRQTERIPEERRLRGHARFVDTTTLVVDDHTRVEARTVVIATGSVPFVPPELAELFAPGSRHPDVMTSDDIFELDHIPESLAVIGTGVIGLELGQAMHRLGARTEFFSPFAQIGPLSDPVVHQRALEELSAEMPMHLLNREFHAEPAPGGGLNLRWVTADGEQRSTHVAKLLLAAGRRPNVAGLDLDRTGLELDARGVPFIDHHTMQCGASPVFLAGDVTAEHMVLHEAADEGRMAGRNAAAFPDVRAHLRRIPLAICFTDPNIAIVGDRLAELDPNDVAYGEVSYDTQGRARIMARNRGVVRLYGSRETGRLLGAEMFAPGAEHTSHLLAWAVQQNITVDAALELPFYHPVLEEGIRTALRSLSDHLKLTPELATEQLRYGPGAE